MSLSNRVQKLEGKHDQGWLVTPAPDGSLPDSFQPFMDGVDYSSVPASLIIKWKGKPLDELALIAGPNAISHEQALEELS